MCLTALWGLRAGEPAAPAQLLWRYIARSLPCSLAPAAAGDWLAPGRTLMIGFGRKPGSLSSFNPEIHLRQKTFLCDTAPTHC